ncbi:Ribonuclease H domain [Macleaya cordata]|uniref:Ribonuclease H domain n=1 Tax=Macleaya cordata TaxID=56857 RepID=A0A200R9D2_MACCD|nr:Ribonuclease H domain [Macleaya cordata]
MDGCSLGNPGMAGCGGIFRSHEGSVLGCFAANIGVETQVFTEFLAALWALEIAPDKGWTPVWLECDSMLVILALQDSFKVPWRLQIR